MTDQVIIILRHDGGDGANVAAQMTPTSKVSEFVYLSASFLHSLRIIL